ncbi:MAG: phosphonate metabolism protein/1,5-bisphosphokinase (PRPP-forming) PhnN [Haliea sp.]|nr:MAG: phosphonate metabolism protein/1,5-bisphosphokinase (PRPP-forming) PhnN [Haliea sp.]
MKPSPTAGRWVFVCGPSGSGKDSVIAQAQQALEGRSTIVFARRFITRPAQAASDHEALDAPAFANLLETGGLCWHWQTHGFFYGISRAYGNAFHAGCVVVVNGSREHVAGLAASPDLSVVHITADQDTLAERLARRGRDTPASIAQRLARNNDLEGLRADCVIVNNGELAAAGRQLAAYLEDAVAALTPTSTPA